LNMILVAGGTVFILFEIYVSMKEFYIAWRLKRRRKITVTPIDSSPSENNCSSPEEVAHQNGEVNESQNNMSMTVVGLNEDNSMTKEIETIYLVDQPKDQS